MTQKSEVGRSQAVFAMRIFVILMFLLGICAAFLYFS